MSFPTFVRPAAFAVVWDQVEARYPDLAAPASAIPTASPPHVALAESVVAYALTGSLLDRLDHGLPRLPDDPTDHLSDREMRQLMTDLAWRLTEVLYRVDNDPDAVAPLLEAVSWRWGDRQAAAPAILQNRSHEDAGFVVFPLPLAEDGDYTQVGLHPKPVAASRFYTSAGEMLTDVGEDQTPRLITWNRHPSAVLAPYASHEKNCAKAHRFKAAKAISPELNIAYAEKIIPHDYPGGFNHRDEANALAFSCFRRFLESWHDSARGLKTTGSVRQCRDGTLAILAVNARDQLATHLRMRDADFPRYRSHLVGLTRDWCIEWDRLTPSALRRNQRFRVKDSV